MPTRGVRGATTVDENTSEAILKETRRLLALLIHFNGIQPEDVASLIFIALTPMQCRSSGAGGLATASARFTGRLCFASWGGTFEEC